MTDDIAVRAILSQVEQRGAGKTCCPSEIARTLAGPGGDWRAFMPQVHRAATDLHERGKVRITWKGADRKVADGAYRIGRPNP
ncbi:MAG: DUF3253 domain-containing protein [Pontixanthobacter sp.]